ncbi:TetR/AcrR family transcriptional regulator [Tessaracoccus caeni]|uniref:TetR/AcrR family transcriptional regulator n=1 Tax=Tessaracoccus caeni TaxID=3031239 RepID=UPI0023D9C7B5|nr:TetR family transcriptional regulator [Tessaracoccus caeni]MDF1489669.1 TetR family transcriptional regulator [Tessaracoccus caeni]
MTSQSETCGHGGQPDIEADAADERDAPTRGPQGQRGEVRERIAKAARSAFIELGYDDATIRHIARLAGCDAAMVTYYFGSKQRLFRECFNLPSDPASEILQLFLPDLSTAGERLVRHALVMYEERVTSDAMLALMRALITDASTSQRFRTYIRTDVLDKVTAYLGAGREVAEEIELAIAQMYGVAVLRYVVQLEPLASMPRERVVRTVAPFIQARIDRIAREYL